MFSAEKIFSAFIFFHKIKIKMRRSHTPPSPSLTEQELEMYTTPCWSDSPRPGRSRHVLEEESSDDEEYFKNNYFSAGRKNSKYLEDEQSLAETVSTLTADDWEVKDITDEVARKQSKNLVHNLKHGLSVQEPIIQEDQFTDGGQYIRFCFTQFLPPDAVHPIEAAKYFELARDNYNWLWREGKVTYIVAGLEQAPTTGRWHLQGYFENPPQAKQRVNAAKKKLININWPSVSIRPANKDGHTNRTYCLKLSGQYKQEPNKFFIEFGTIREANPGKRMKSDWEATRTLARQGLFDDIPASHYIPYLRSIHQIRFNNIQPERHQLSTLKNYWIHGPPGTGKSRAARALANCNLEPEKNLAIYDKLAENRWWDCYNGEPVVLIDDLECSAKHMAHELKRAADLYSFRAEVKGASTYIRPSHIIVTSNYTPEDIWHGDVELINAIRRRFIFLELHDWDVFYNFMQNTDMLKMKAGTTTKFATLAQSITYVPKGQAPSFRILPPNEWPLPDQKKQ